MALYVGSSKKKLNMGGKLFAFQIIQKSQNESRLFSSDNYVLKDKNDVFITTKDGELLWR